MIVTFNLQERQWVRIADEAHNSELNNIKISFSVQIPMQKNVLINQTNKS